METLAGGHIREPVSRTPIALGLLIFSLFFSSRRRSFSGGMAGESGDWVLMATAQTLTPTPLDPDHLCTTTTVAVSPAFDQDRMWLNGKGKVPFVSTGGIHQLQIIIFVLAVFHVLYCVIPLALSRAKMRSWKHWEKETGTAEYEFAHDPEQFRFARQTSFGKRHLSFWTKIPVLMWMAHLAPQSHQNFNFQKYINPSLEEDFKVVVGIRAIMTFGLNALYGRQKQDKNSL